MRRVVRAALAAALLVPLSVAGSAVPASAAGQVIGHVAYVTGGNVWYDGRQLTHDGNDNWPRIRPGGDVVVYSHGTQLWVVGTAAGSTPHVLVDTGGVSRPAWSPTGDRLAYIDRHSYGLYLAWYVNGALLDPRHLDEAGPLGGAGTGWTGMLAQTAAVAWSPDGRYIAHTGGSCLGELDYCLSMYDLLALADRYVVGFSGSGGNITSGFANIPAFSADSSTLYLTTQHDDPEHGVFEEGPLQVVTCGVGANCWITNQVRVGRDGDTVASPSPLLNTATLLVTGANAGQAWITRVRADGTRTLLYQGYGQDWIG